MRQMCNLAYTALTRDMDPKQLDRFKAEMQSVPGQKPSHGAKDLMAVMMGAKR